MKKLNISCRVIDTAAFVLRNLCNIPKIHVLSLQCWYNNVCSPAIWTIKHFFTGDKI